MQRGFTLVELLLVMAVFGFLFLIVGSISLNTLPKSQLLIEADVVEQTLRKAQAHSVNQQEDSKWGVHASSDSMTLFAGETYETRDTNFDSSHSFPSGITASGLSDVVFEFRTGETQHTGTITLTANATGQTKVLTINSLGRVNQ